MTDNQNRGRDLFVEPYDQCTLSLFSHVISGIVGYAAGFAVLWLFYHQTVFSLFAALAFVPAAIVMRIGASKKKRMTNLLRQFQNFLDSLVVSLQSGRTELGSIESAAEDLALMYSEKADIVKEARLIVQKFNNRQKIGEALADFAERCGLEDIKVFAEVYSAIEGKGEKTREIVARTQKILADKIEIEAEIKTIISGAANELNIIVVIPVIMVAIMGFMGGELMAGLFTTAGGHIVATISIIVFIGAYLLGKKMSNIDV